MTDIKVVEMKFSLKTNRNFREIRDQQKALPVI